jgi:hypothetical protein
MARERRAVVSKKSGTTTGRSTINFETAPEIGVGLPGVEEGTAFGQPALKIRGQLMACGPSHRSAELPARYCCAWIWDDRCELLAAEPDVYYIPEHYVGYSGVLVRLARVDRELLRDLLGMAHKFVTRRAEPRSPARKSRKPAPRR